MKLRIAAPVNGTQVEFRRLCEAGGGQGGGPVARKVLELLRDSGKHLNRTAHSVATEHLEAVPGSNPWHACFSVGLCWGHLARPEMEFTQLVVRALADLDDEAMRLAAGFHFERGPDPIEQSIRGGRALFGMVTLPNELPSTLDTLTRAQDRWFGPILGPNRPPYIGSWNATAMFMVALFAQPELAATHVVPRPVLPPGGPIFEGLRLLHRTGVLPMPPDGGSLDDAGFEPGVLYLNNALLAQLCVMLDAWSLIDVHSGLYMLGTRHPHSRNWIQS